MRGKPLAYLPFDTEPERTLRARLKRAKQERLTTSEGNPTIPEKEEEVSVHLEHSDSDTKTIPQTMIADPPPPVERLLGDYGGNNAPAGRMTIVNQPLNAAHFQLHPSTINQLERWSFLGRVNEDANKHLQRFLTMSTTLKIYGHSEEAKRLRMFPFTLTDEAEEWFYSLPAGSIITWEKMEKAFLNEYFPASVSLRKRHEILNFKQKEGESLGDTYKRFKRLLVACPTHNMDDTEQMQMFVNGLRLKTRKILDSAAGGSFNFATATGMKKIIEVIAANEHLELYDSVTSKPEGVIDLKLEANKQVKIEEPVVIEVEKRLKALNIGTQKVAQVQQTPSAICEICNGPHKTVHCLATPQQIEEIKFLKQNNPYSNTHNPGWNYHPNFSWKDQQQQAPQKAEWEVDIEKMATYNSQFQEETRKNHKNTTASIRNLAVQVGQIAQYLSLQAQSTLLSSTVINPKNQENVNAVITRSKNIPESEKDDETGDNMVIEVDLEVRETEKTTKEVVTPVEPNGEKIKKEAKPMIKLPFPTRVAKQDSKEKEFEKFTTLFKKRIPIKKKDPGAVAIPCTINDINFPKVLIDSGASVSLMPLSIFKKLGIGTVREKGKKPKFANHTIKQAYGMAKDVLVEIDRFIFPVDFEIMDIPEDEETPIILGRTFMLTSGCNIDIEIGNKWGITNESYEAEIGRASPSPLCYKLIDSCWMNLGLIASG
ncbi:uncharacterized protein LOC131649491 [Vicia villosa]|uniref:uncharacterized protein LOC131649491 n=1 Tax=Vicia villosa TaxID=3911 RepID=UPI00273BB23D|nr:uncharacterized protein LOC131649491 [Vicia villosa]